MDLSFTLRTIMAARGLSVAEMADMAGVSKSAMEKYLKGPSSPRAIAIASLAKGLGMSADTIMFGELDATVELVYKLSFDAFADLIKDLKNASDLSARFRELAHGTDDFDRFIRDLAYERAVAFRSDYNIKRREKQMNIVML